MTVSLGSYVKVALRVAVLRRCWRHSLGCALLAEELSEACEVQPDQAYTAGLLHDVGRLALLVKYPESYADLLSVVMENGFCLLQGERDLFDIDHCEAGAWLGQEWAFPPSLVQAIGSHHQPCEAHCPSLPKLVGLACRMAGCLGLAAVDPLEPEDPHDVLVHLPRSVQLRPEDLEEMRLRVNEKVNALE
jgi:putative nucleotidyltransferase with HDIG domain